MVCDCDSRQQKQAKEEERALKAADKAAEEAAAKARQAALDEESRKKREDERSKREATKKAMDEEKARKEEDRKKRAQEEREREQDRERKKKEREDKTKKEREERERKAKEEREARLAKEKEEKAEKDRVEKEKKEERVKKVANEKAEKEAKEKLAAQQRTTAAASASTLASGSGKGSARANNAVASSSTATTPVKSNSSSTSSVTAPALQRLPNNSSGSNGNDTPSKKPANKPIPTLVTNPLPPGILGQGTRPAVQQPNLSRPSHLPSPSPINPQQPHLPQPMMYGHPQGPVGMISPSAMSPRVGNFPPMAYGYGGPNMQQQQPLSPVPPRGFNGGSFDPTFNRGIPIGVGVPLGALPPPPIGPPTKAMKTATPGPASAGLAPGQGRHASASSNDASGPGPITRPMAPIARPTAGGGNGEASSGSGSPNCRSPSPSRVLGSSALAADDDEVVSAHGPRRATTIGTMPIGGGPGGQNWGSASPRSALSEANLRSGPWTASAFSSARTAIGPNNHLHQLHHPGPSLWGNTPGNGNGENWHPQSPAFFTGPPYINHNAAASSTPHTST